MYVDQAARGYPTLFHPDASQNWANPSSSHRLGKEARDALLQARQRLARSVSLPVTNSDLLSKQIVFTSGGTESNNLVLLQPTWKFLVTVATEHHAVYYPSQYMANHTACEVVYLSVDGQGRIRDLDDLRRVLSVHDGPGLVSLAYVNNETGNILDVVAVGRIIQAANGHRNGADRVWFHTDAVQAPGHAPIDMGANGALATVDFVSLSSHKFHGPPGFGALVCRSVTPLHRPLMFGGTQQGGLRPGTESVGAVLAMVAAFVDANDPTNLQQRMAHLRSLTDR